MKNIHALSLTALLALSTTTMHGMELHKTKSQKDVVKKQLIQRFGKSFIAEYKSYYGQEGVLELARKTADSGVHFKTPVFYDRNAIEVIKKERDEFEIVCSNKQKINAFANDLFLFEEAYYNTDSLRIMLQNNYYLSLFKQQKVSYNYNDYSLLGAAIIGKIATVTQKRQLIYLMQNYPMRRFCATKKDEDLAWLELYERKLTHWNKIRFLATTMPIDVIKLIAQLIIDDEESLL